MKIGDHEKIDRDDLHRYLESHANNRGRIVVSVTKLAEGLGIRADHMSRILNQMCASGRLQKVVTSTQGVTFSVRPFKDWASETGYRVPRRRRA